MLLVPECRHAAQQLLQELHAAQAAVSDAQAAKLKLEQELTSQQFTVQVGRKGACN